MIPYCEKALCRVAHEIMYTLLILFNKLLNVNIYRVYLILLLLLLNVLAFCNFLTKTTNLCKSHRSRQ